MEHNHARTKLATLKREIYEATTPLFGIDIMCYCCTPPISHLD